MSLLGLVVPLWARLAAIAALAAALFGYGYMKGLAHEEHAREQATMTFMQEGDHHVAMYHERVRGLADAGAVGDRLQRLCDAGVVRDPGGPHEAAAANADHRRADEEARRQLKALAAELPACEANRIQLEELQATLRPQLQR